MFSALEVSAERCKTESSALSTNILSDALSMSRLVGFFFLAFLLIFFSYLFSCPFALGCCLLYPLKPLTRQSQLLQVSVRSGLPTSPTSALPVRCFAVFLKIRFSSLSVFSSPLLFSSLLFFPSHLAMSIRLGLSSQVLPPPSNWLGLQAHMAAATFYFLSCS